MIVVNKHGTTRNIDEKQYNEYKRKGYEKVEVEPVVEEAPKYNTVVTDTTTNITATNKKRNK